MTAKYTIYFHVDYLSSLSDHRHYEQYLEQLFESNRSSSIPYSQFKILMFLAVELAISSSLPSKSPFMSSIIFLPGQLDETIVNNLIIKSAYKSYKNTFYTFLGDNKFSPTRDLVSKLEHIGESPTLLVTPIINSHLMCISILITDLDSERCWTFEPSADNLGNFSLKHILENDIPDYGYLARNQELFCHYLFSNLIQRLKNFEICDSVYIKDKRFLGNRFNILRGLVTKEKMAKHFILLFIMYEFIKEMGSGDNVSIKASILSVLKILNSPMQKYFLTDFSTQLLNVYNITRMEKKESYNTDYIIIFPFDLRTLDLKTKSNNVNKHGLPSLVPTRNLIMSNRTSLQFSFTNPKAENMNDNTCSINVHSDCHEQSKQAEHQFAELETQLNGEGVDLILPNDILFKNTRHLLQLYYDKIEYDFETETITKCIFKYEVDLFLNVAKSIIQTDPASRSRKGRRNKLDFFHFEKHLLSGATSKSLNSSYKTWLKSNLDSPSRMPQKL